MSEYKHQKVTLNFKKWLLELGCALTGLAATKDMPDQLTNHVWRFVRSDLCTTFVANAVECHHPGWDGMPVKDNDCILLAKHFLGSTGYSQDFGTGKTLQWGIE